MKSIDRMTEEEILRELCRVIPSYADSADWDQDRCVSLAMDRLRKLFSESRHIGYIERMMEKDRLEMEALVEHYRPLAGKRIAAIRLARAKKEMLRDIGRARLETVVLPALKAAGLEVDMICFPWSAKLKLALPCKKRAEFCISYRDLDREGFLDSLIGALLQLKEVTRHLGREFHVL